MNRRMLHWPVAAMLLAATGIASAESGTETHGGSGYDSGMRVYVDPESGELVSAPVTDEQKATAAKANAAFSQDESQIIDAVAADGSPMRILNGQFELAVGVAVDNQGNRVPYCVDAAHVNQGRHSHALSATESGVR